MSIVSTIKGMRRLIALTLFLAISTLDIIILPMLKSPEAAWTVVFTFLGALAAGYFGSAWIQQSKATPPTQSEGNH